MHFFSKRPLVSSVFRYLFDAFTPTLFTGAELSDEEIVQFIGTHPQPPMAWSQPTTLRDAHLLSVALEARSSEAPTIVAGDLNAAAWETVTQRAARIAG